MSAAEAGFTTQPNPITQRNTAANELLIMDRFPANAGDRDGWEASRDRAPASAVPRADQVRGRWSTSGSDRIPNMVPSDLNFPVDRPGADIFQDQGMRMRSARNTSLISRSVRITMLHVAAPDLR